MNSDAPSWTFDYPDLASRYIYGAVIWANNEFFAEKEALIRPNKPQFTPAQFGAKGQIYDGWETRRRRGTSTDRLPEISDYDCAIIRLGVPGSLRGFAIDTTWFTGNYPPYIAIDGLLVADHAPADQIADSSQWETLIDKTVCNGNGENYYELTNNERTYSHIRLRIFPDGGVARCRVYGIPRMNPHYAQLPCLDLAALTSGAYVSHCSNRFYSSPNNAISPGKSRVMGDGWETRRRRNSGNEWLEIQLAGQAVVELIEIDTSYYIGNSPASAQVVGITRTQYDTTEISPPTIPSDAIHGEYENAIPLVAPTDLIPDTNHRFLIATHEPIDALRLDIFPDGGISRIHAWGHFTAAGIKTITAQWNND